MLTCTQSKSSDAAVKYFNEVLTVGDYYIGQEITGTWQGKTAELLGLETGSLVEEGQFNHLMYGRHPTTGEQLTQRLRKDRRPGLDLTFSLPKTISMVWAINKDKSILDIMREAVRETMKEDVEPLACRRVRTGKHAWSQHQKTTGNLVFSDFLHKTSRPVDGRPDPHLHFHCFVMNTTVDEGKHYALEPEQIFRQRYSLQAKFEARLARKLKYELGYEVEKVRYRQSKRWKTGWEIAGISRETIEKFSRRTTQIEDYAEEHGITDAKEKEKISLKTREKKDPGLSIQELREEWRSRLTPEELEVFEKLRIRSVKAVDGESEQLLAQEALLYALDHHLYRSSTVEKHTLLGTALEQALFLSPEQLEKTLQKSEALQAQREERGTARHLVTTKEVYAAEQNMIEFAQKGRGTRIPIGRGEHQFERDWLNEEQKAAVNHILQSRDTVTAVMGGAGVGKTSTIKEAATAIEKNNKQLYVFAPSTGARDVLVKEGLQQAETVEHLIRNEKLHPQLRKQVILIDEAALMDVRSMNEVFRIAENQNCRVILTGDTRQHSSPRRGEALRILNERGGLQAARIEKIQRQQGQYKRAVELVSQGNQVINPRTGQTGLLAGFDELDKMGKIVEIAGEERHEILAKRYLKQINKKEQPLVIAPSHAEGEMVTDCIREKLIKSGAIGEAKKFDIIQSLNLSEAEKKTEDVYQSPNLVVQFHQNAPGVKRGERFRIGRDERGKLAMKPLKGRKWKAFPRHLADRFEVYETSKKEFAVGDKIRLTLGGKTKDEKTRLSNGQILEIKGFDPQGNIRLKNGKKIDKNYGHWDHGYVLTSHDSQGKDSKEAITAIGSQSLPAVSSKQFYVSVSRGKEDTTIYVEDKEAVRRAIQQSGEQLSATEMLTDGGEQLQQKRQQQYQHIQYAQQAWQQRNHSSRQAQINKPYQPTPSQTNQYPNSPSIDRT